jgi:1,4-alpha-glucan branching enzyme
MSGDAWQKFANLRAYYGFMWAHPGKKLLFMGGEFAQGREWNYDTGLDWYLLEVDWHAKVQRLVSDLNHLYCSTPALYLYDCEAQGFQWINANDSENSVYSFLRLGDPKTTPPVVVVCNFTPVIRQNYRIGLPKPGFYSERLNTDADCYGGSNTGNFGGAYSQAMPWLGQPYSMVITLPPLATVIFELEI